jgi:hypothetical protein
MALLWLTLELYQAANRPWPVSNDELAAAAGFVSFGLLHYAGLRWGERVPPGWRWTLLAAPLPWLAAFLVHLLDDDLSYPGDGFLPPTWHAAATGYVVILLALASASLLGALSDALGSLRARPRS